MKKIFTITAMLFVIAAASAQSIEKLFDKYQNDERFQYIYQKKAGQLDEIMDMDVLSDTKSSMRSAGKKMLVLTGADESLVDNFTKEVQQALSSDKFENTSLVRTGKNRVEEYLRQTAKSRDKISFILNPGNITLVWYSYLSE